MFESPPGKTTVASSTIKPKAGTASGTVDSVAVAAAAKSGTLPLTPAAALERYRRVLTSYERDEIKQYPQVYFVGATARKVHGNPTNPSLNHGYDDDKGRYKCVKNDHISYRYEVMRGLGKGSFGDVVKGVCVSASLSLCVSNQATQQNEHMHIPVTHL